MGPWLILALLITVAWGVQAYYMRKAASVGVNDGTPFGYMALSGLLLVPVAFTATQSTPRATGRWNRLSQRVSLCSRLRKSLVLTISL